MTNIVRARNLGHWAIDLLAAVIAGDHARARMCIHEIQGIAKWMLEEIEGGGV